MNKKITKKENQTVTSTTNNVSMLSRNDGIVIKIMVIPREEKERIHVNLKDINTNLHLAHLRKWVSIVKHNEATPTNKIVQ